MCRCWWPAAWLLQGSAVPSTKTNFVPGRRRPGGIKNHDDLRAGCQPQCLGHVAAAGSQVGVPGDAHSFIGLASRGGAGNRNRARTRGHHRRATFQIDSVSIRHGARARAGQVEVAFVGGDQTAGHANADGVGRRAGAGQGDVAAGGAEVLAVRRDAQWTGSGERRCRAPVTLMRCEGCAIAANGRVACEANGQGPGVVEEDAAGDDWSAPPGG